MRVCVCDAMRVVTMCGQLTVTAASPWHVHASALPLRVLARSALASMRLRQVWQILARPANLRKAGKALESWQSIAKLARPDSCGIRDSSSGAYCHCSRRRHVCASGNIVERTGK